MLRKLFIALAVAGATLALLASASLAGPGNPTNQPPGPESPSARMPLVGLSLTPNVVPCNSQMCTTGVIVERYGSHPKTAVLHMQWSGLSSRGEAWSVDQELPLYFPPDHRVVDLCASFPNSSFGNSVTFSVTSSWGFDDSDWSDNEIDVHITCPK
jgi:hypothetical protein